MSDNKTSKELLGELLKKNSDDATEAKAKGELVAWSNAVAPQEILAALGIHTVYTESHAALLGAKKQAQGFIEHAEADGYAIDVCSYAKVNIGYSHIRESMAGNIPMPDLLFCCNNICNTAVKWYENLAKEMNIPMILFDMPFNHTYDVPDSNVEYIRGQIDSAIVQLEEISGEKFDYDRLKEIMKTTAEAGALWKKAMSLAAAKPSPLSGFDMFNYMGAIISLRTKPEAIDLFKLWVSELEEKISRKEGVWTDGAEEKYRILWDGIVCWPSLGNTAKVLKKNGINVVTATYPASFPCAYDPKNLNSLARTYAANYVNCNTDVLVDNIVKLVTDCSLDGVLYHSNRSCKLMDFRIYEIQRRVKECTGVASVIVDGDQTDTRSFSLAQYETRIQALMEMMENEKFEGGRPDDASR